MFINLSLNNLKSNNIFSDIFKSQLDRGIIPGEYNSYFCRYLGIDNIEVYNNNLASLNRKQNNSLKIIEFPLNIDATLYNDINEKIRNYGEEFFKYVNLFDDNSINFRTYKALSFIYDNIKEYSLDSNVTIKIIKFIVVFSRAFMKDLQWNDLETNKFVFYGHPRQEEAYLMLFSKLIGIDVLYLNPVGNDIDNYIRDIDNYSFKLIEKSNFENKTFSDYANSGVVVSEYKTIGKEAAYELEKTMFNEETGFYKPWQFIDYSVNSVLLNSTFEEIMIYYNEKAMVRPGFRVKNNTVDIPNFFAVITGANSNQEEFGEFLRTIFNKEKALILDNIALYNYPITYDEAMSYKECFDNTGRIVKEKINFHVAESRFKNYRESLKGLFVDKVNDILNNSYVINSKFNERDKIEFFATIMTMPEEFYQLIDSFDFTDNIPKITIYRDNNRSLEIRELYILTFLNAVGVDIILYSGFGTYGIEKWTNKNFITYHRLEKVEYNFNLENAMKAYKKKGFFSKLFKK